MDYRMKMLPFHYEALNSCLIADTDVEQGCFALCTISKGNKRTALLIKEIIPLSESDFAIQEKLRLSVSPQAMLHVARKAQAGNYAICMIHTHPVCDGYVEFSGADDYGNLRTFPFFHRMQPGLLHSCLVFDKNLKHVSGRIYDKENTWARINNVEIIGIPRALVTTNDGDAKDTEEQERFLRQAPLLGAKGQTSLQKIRLGIVGYGGLGASASMIAVHTGFQHVLGIDPDIIETSNLPRVTDATGKDVKEKVLKVNIGKRYAERINPEIEFIVLPCPVEDPSAAPYLKDCDALIATSDTTRSRALLNQFCQQHYIPLLDIGVEFVTDKNGDICNDIGKVNLILPGTPCLHCSMHINPERLRAEALPKEQREHEIQEGYIRGMNIPQPSMMMFNMQIAARGIQRLVEYFTGLKDINSNVYEHFSFLEQSGREYHSTVKKITDPDCLFCHKDSMYLGQGDVLPMLISPILPKTISKGESS